jgi:hypothetical protein
MILDHESRTVYAAIIAAGFVANPKNPYVEPGDVADHALAIVDAITTPAPSADSGNGIAAS